MKVYSVQEIADHLGVKAETVRWWKSQDPAFPPVTQVGRSWGLTADRLAAWEAVRSSDGGRGHGVAADRAGAAPGARPVWTPARVEALLRLVCLRRDVLARTRRDLAAGLGVHPSTVRRWLRRRGSWKGAPAAIPQGRLEELLREVAVTPADAEREAFQESNAHKALARLRAGRVPLAPWREQQWLVEHRVWVEDRPEGSSAVRLTRVGTRRDRAEPGAENVRSLIVANRFEAQLVKAAVLREVSPWRVRLPGLPGGAERWISGAKVRPLEVLHEDAARSGRGRGRA